MRITKTIYLRGFVAVTLFLTLIRIVFPGITGSMDGDSKVADKASTLVAEDSVNVLKEDSVLMPTATQTEVKKTAVKSRFFSKNGSPTKNRIFSVPGFSATFPDQNDVQIIAAKKWGVTPVANREDAEMRKAELVYVGANPYFHIDKLNNSIPYLVPRASVLLQDIGRSFFDSLQCKGMPLHKIIVTSVLRTTDDVDRLRQRNSNATQNSCHLYGTTFDICYNRYKTVEAPGETRRAVRNDSLKWVFSEVLRDMRDAGRCYVKYEVKQGCFHITVR